MKIKKITPSKPVENPGRKIQEEKSKEKKKTDKSDFQKELEKVEKN